MGKVFDIGREMLTPHDCGLCFGTVTMEEIRALSLAPTARERGSEFARYYDEPLGPIQPEHQAAIDGGPLLPKDCYMPCDVAAHMNNESYDAHENGYGVLENGVGFAAVKIDQEGITDEMIRHFRENFAHFDDLYYKIWFPGAHLRHYKDGALEDFGWGMLNMHMMFNTELRAFGLDEAQILERDKRCIGALSSTATSMLVAAPEQGEEVMSMFCYTRDTGHGRELRIRYWLGLSFDDFGQVYIRRNPGKVGMLTKAKMQMEHCMREYCNQTKLIREFWESR